MISNRLIQIVCVFSMSALALVESSLAEEAGSSYAKELKQAQRLIERDAFDDARGILRTILSREPANARALRLLGESFIEEGKAGEGLAWVLYAWRLQGNRDRWSREDEKIYQECDAAVHRYDIKNRDLRKADDAFLRNSLRLLKKFNHEETRDIYLEILNVCREIRPGEKKLRKFFEKPWIGENRFGSRMARNEDYEEFDPDRKRAEDASFSLYFNMRVDAWRFRARFLPFSLSNESGRITVPDGRLIFDIRHGDPYYYVEHRRIPFQPEKQLKITFEIRGKGRLILGAPEKDCALVVDFGGRAYPLENPSAARGFSPTDSGYAEAVLQFSENEFLRGYVNGTEIFNRQLSRGEVAMLTRSNVLFGTQCESGNCRIRSVEYGPVREIVTVGKDVAALDDCRPVVLESDRKRAVLLRDAAAEFMQKKSWSDAIVKLSEAIGMNPLYWDAYRNLGDAQEAAGRRRAAVLTWKRALQRTEAWGGRDDAAKRLRQYSRQRLDAIDKEGKKWEAVVKKYVSELLALRDVNPTDVQRIRRIDWRIRLLDTHIPLAPVKAPEAKEKEKPDAPLPDANPFDEDGIDLE